MNEPWKELVPAQGYTGPPVLTFFDFPVGYFEEITLGERRDDDPRPMIYSNRLYRLHPMTLRLIFLHGNRMYPPMQGTQGRGYLKLLLYQILDYISPTGTTYSERGEIAFREFMCLLFFTFAKEVSDTLKGQLDVLFNWLWDYSATEETALAGMLKGLARKYHVPFMVYEWSRLFCHNMLEEVMRSEGVLAAWSFQHNRWAAMREQDKAGVALMQKIYDRRALRCRANPEHVRMGSPAMCQFDNETWLYVANKEFVTDRLTDEMAFLELAMRLSDVNPTGSTRFPRMYYDLYSVMFGRIDHNYSFYYHSEDDAAATMLNLQSLEGLEHDVKDSKPSNDSSWDRSVQDTILKSLVEDKMYRWQHYSIKLIEGPRATEMRPGHFYVWLLAWKQTKNSPVKDWDPTPESVRQFLDACSRARGFGEPAPEAIDIVLE